VILFRSRHHNTAASIDMYQSRYYPLPKGCSDMKKKHPGNE
jgi:hypothetical protein